MIASRPPLSKRPPAPLLLLVAAAVSVLFLYLPYQHQSGGGVLHAQEAQPVIHSVDPEPPVCILWASPHLSHRTLTITGENFGDFNTHTLRFRRVHTQEISIFIGVEVNWESPTRITVDMDRIKGHLWGISTVRLQVQIASTPPSYTPLSNWSSEFTLADHAESCGVSRPAPTPVATPDPTPGPTPFPATPAVRGVSGDLWADVILGKPNFSEAGPDQVVPFKVFNPGGVVVDRSVNPGRAYVWDSGNSRILGIDLADCYANPSPCAADLVIGQPSGYDHSGCNGDGGPRDYPDQPLAGPDTLCGIPSLSISPWETHTFVTMAVDGSGALYVPDSFNHRVLKYDSPFENDSVADEVWGQADFSGTMCNRGDFARPTAETVCFHSHTSRLSTNLQSSGVEVDSDGSLWVADSGNHRVLRFPVDPEHGGVARVADLVLGQTAFDSAKPGSALDKLHAPSAVRTDPNGWVYVADTGNDRVLVFKPPFESGMEADLEFGSQLHHPTSLEIDPSGRGIWIHDSGNRMVELWDMTGTSVLKVLGKDSYRPDPQCGRPISDLLRTPHLCPTSGGLGIDGLGNVLVSVFLRTADVLRFADPTADDGLIGRLDRRLFYPPPQPNLRGTEGIRSARGVAVFEDQLVVSDIGRLMFWNGLDTLSNGRPADGIVGDAYFVQPRDSCCGRIKADSSGRLWVLAFEGIDFLDVYELPLTEYSAPVHTVRKAESSFPVLGTEARVKIGRRIFGIAPVGGGDFLWLSDTDNHRVLRIRDPLTNPVVDVILGQKEPAGVSCNRGELTPRSNWWEGIDGLTPDMICFPGVLSIDRLGNLYVSDHALEVNGNHRLLVFSAETLETTNSEAILGPHAAKVFVNSASDRDDLWMDHRGRGSVPGASAPVFQSAAAWEPAFDSTNRMVVGYNAYLGPRFVGVYDDPLGPDALPASYLYDFGSMPYAAAFDDDDNLYVGDINRSRVLVYRNPFDNPARPAPPPALDDPAPLPRYETAITAVGPRPPYCVVRQPDQAYEQILDITFNDLPRERDLHLEFRRVTDAHAERLHLRPAMIEEGIVVSVNVQGEQLHIPGLVRSRIVVDMNRYGKQMWPERGRLTMTVRIIELDTPGSDPKPISGWSPAFVLAESAEACGRT